MDAIVKDRITAPLRTPTALGEEARKAISAEANVVLADIFALYLKTKNFHWHMSGPHFRDWHMMLDDHSEALIAMTDPLAERVRALGGLTLHSIGEIASLQRLKDNDAEYVEPHEMLAELREDNVALTEKLRDLHDLCEKFNDVATASLIEDWIVAGEERAWFLFEILRNRV